MIADIIILSKTQALLSKALASICKHVDKKSIGKIVVGWTGEEQPAEQDIEMLGLDVTFESLSHYNFAENNNYLVEKHCMSDCVLFLNDDIELVEDSVTKCLKWHEDENVGTVGIKLLYKDKTIQHAGIFIAVQEGKFKGVGHLYWTAHDQVLPPFLVVGNTAAFCMVKRADFLKIGGFNEKYKHCFEDVEMNLRILGLGKQNICNNATWAWHIESATRNQSYCVEDKDRLARFVESNLSIFMQRN